MSGVFETVRVDAGRVRLRERHLARLRASAVPAAVVRAADAVIERWCGLADAEPVVLRIDIDGCCPRPAPRPPSTSAPLELCTVVAFDPNDVTRERKRRDRAWAEEGEAAAGRG